MFIDMLKAAGVNTELSPDEKWIQGIITKNDWSSLDSSGIATVSLPCKPIELWIITVPTGSSYQTVWHYLQSTERVYGLVGGYAYRWSDGYAIANSGVSPQTSYPNIIYEVTNTYFKMKYYGSSYGSDKIYWLARIPKDTTDSIVTRYAHGENVALPASGNRLEINCGFRPKQFRIHTLPESGCYRENMFYDEETMGTSGYQYGVYVIFQPDGSNYSVGGGHFSSLHYTPELTANGFTLGSISSNYSQHFNWEAWG